MAISREKVAVPYMHRGYVLLAMDDVTFNPSSNVQKTIFIDSPNVPRVQPSIIINSLLCLLLIVQVPHEHMTAIHTDLYEDSDLITSDALCWTSKNF